MLRSNIIKEIFWLNIFLLFSYVGCSVGAKTANVIYLIPEKFEGAVVIFYNQKDGIVPDLNGTEYVFTVPKDGVLKVNIDAKAAGGKPSFFLIDEYGKRTEIELLFRWGPKYPEGMRSIRDISNEERDEKIFAMLYDQGNFNTSDGIVRYRSFLIGTPKDSDNFYTQKERKLTNIQRTFPR